MTATSCSAAAEPVLHDYQTVAVPRATVDAGKKADLLFEVVTPSGRNAKQNNVTLEDARGEAMRADSSYRCIRLLLLGPRAPAVARWRK